jgi:hypothetical protein
VDTDILKPDTGALSISRPAPNSSGGTSERQSGGDTTPEGEGEGEGASKLPAYTEPVSEGEEDEEMDVAPAGEHDTHRRIGLPSADVAAAASFREQHLAEERARRPRGGRDYARGGAVEEAVEDAEDEADADDERTPFLRLQQRRKSQGAAREAAVDNQKPRGLSIDPLAPSSAFDKTLRDRLQKEQKKDHDGDDEDDEDEGEGRADESAPRSAVTGDDRILERNWSAPPGKKIAVPVRIEPKVYFASERTFLVSRGYLDCISTC